MEKHLQQQNSNLVIIFYAGLLWFVIFSITVLLLMIINKIVNLDFINEWASAFVVIIWIISFFLMLKWDRIFRKAWKTKGTKFKFYSILGFLFFLIFIILL